MILYLIDGNLNYYCRLNARIVSSFSKKSPPNIFLANTMQRKVMLIDVSMLPGITL